MFKIIDRPEFTRDVPVTMPDGSEQVLKTSFIGLDGEELETLDMISIEGQKEALRRVVLAFLEVEAPSGEHFAKVCLDEGEEPARLYQRLIAMPNVRIALVNDWARAMAGTKGPRRGN